MSRKIYKVSRVADSMVPIKFVIEGNKITEVIVGDYNFKCRNTPESDRSIIESNFRQLIKRGVLFTKDAKEKEEKADIDERLHKLATSLTKLQRVVLKVFKSKERVKWDEIEKAIKSNIQPEDRRKNIRLIWAGVSAGITRKAQSLDVLKRDEKAFICDRVNETYELNPKLKILKKYV